MTNTEVYSTPNCPFCVRAKMLLRQNGIDFTEIDVMATPDRMYEMIERSGRRSVPQIFIDGKSIGGYEELTWLNSTGELPPPTLTQQGEAS